MTEDISEAFLLFIRHGQTLLNETEKYRGWSDDDSAALDKVGIREAKVAGRFISKLPVKIGIIIASDLDRCIHTAAIVGTILGINDIHYDARLRPLNVGDYTGLDKEKNSIDHYLENPDIQIPGGESVANFRNRWKSFTEDLKTWRAENPGVVPLIVDHLSGIIYWEDMGKPKALRGYLEDYATDKKDLIRPGGVVAVMQDNELIPLLGENRKMNKSDEDAE